MADFGKILEEWDRRSPRDFRRPGRDGQADARETRRGDPARRALEKAMLEGEIPPSRLEEDPAPRLTNADIEELPVEAVLDLHGLTAGAAEEALGLFFRDASARHLRKVLVIHGKGHHSAGEPVLKRTVRTFLESSPLVGRHGTADRRQGGGGAVWVLVRSGDQRSR